MKNLLFVLTVVAAVILTSCSKDADEISPVSQQTKNQLKSSKLVPLKGSTEGFATLVSWTEPSPMVHKLFTGQGQLTHFGNSTMTFDFSYVTVNLDPTLPFNGIILFGASGTIKAANGDECYYTGDFAGDYGPYPYVGLYKFGDWVPSGLTPPYPPYLPTTNEVLPVNCTINGGTGRFEGATGTFKAWGIQWDLPLTFPPTLESYSIPTPTKFWCDGEINY